MIGRTFDHCRLVERLGADGMGEVYRAHAKRRIHGTSQASAAAPDRKKRE